MELEILGMLVGEGQLKGESYGETSAEHATYFCDTATCLVPNHRTNSPRVQQPEKWKVSLLTLRRSCLHPSKLKVTC